MKSGAWSQEEHALAIALWDQGASIQTIADELNRSLMSVQNRMTRKRKDFARRIAATGKARAHVPAKAPPILQEILAASIARGWSDRRLCEVAGIGPNTLCAWAGGHCDPRATNLAALAGALGFRLTLAADADAEAMSLRAQAFADRHARAA